VRYGELDGVMADRTAYLRILSVLIGAVVGVPNVEEVTAGAVAVILGRPKDVTGRTLRGDGERTRIPGGRRDRCRCRERWCPAAGIRLRSGLGHGPAMAADVRARLRGRVERGRSARFRRIGCQEAEVDNIVVVITDIGARAVMADVA